MGHSKKLSSVCESLICGQTPFTFKKIIMGSEFFPSNSKNAEYEKFSSGRFSLFLEFSSFMLWVNFFAKNSTLSGTLLLQEKETGIFLN